MKLRPIKPADIKNASKIVGQNYSRKYEKRSFTEMEAMFKNHAVKPRYIVAEEEGEILGFAGYIQSWITTSTIFSGLTLCRCTREKG
jgi:L-amino acid N-acyltransferase YncA